MSWRWCGVLAVVAGCGAVTPTTDAGTQPDAGAYVPTESRRLGLNDVTYLFPLVVDGGSPFPAADTIIPRVLFDRLSTVPGDVLTDLQRLRLVGLRFDLCDRAKPETCASSADGVIRLVLQPIFNDDSAEDVAFHAFFPVPRAEVPVVVYLGRAVP
jgi:hypothetical protein